VKKVLFDKNKVGIMDPKTKKRFTVVINDKSTLNGFTSINKVKKCDLVEGKYVVTSDGKYIAQQLFKKQQIKLPAYEFQRKWFDQKELELTIAIN
jgi:hypothetical protein|tara:strand:+ start:690 stop:974 length:285 start_codon:yes stop_codon:yes gene_type:complete